MAAPTRKRLTAEARRAEILDAASAVFSARGYHAAALDDIAREAGVSKALIYEHFSSKQELHADLVEAHAAELYERLVRAVPSVDGSASRLAAGLNAFFAFVEERRDAWRMLFREAADPEAVAVLDRMLVQVTAVVAALIAAEPGAQKLPQGKAEREQGIHLIAQMLVGAVQTVANWWAENPEISREHLVETAMGFAWLGLDRLSRGERWTAG
jgi:AcrR family transcriptional regulator